MGFVLTFFSKSAFICPLSDSESAALFEALAAEPNPSATAKVKRKLMSFIVTSECLFACDCMYIYRRCCGCGDGERSVDLNVRFAGVVRLLLGAQR